MMYEQLAASRLNRYSAHAMRVATSVSLRYCALIRKGERVPHARHWPPLQRLVDGKPRQARVMPVLKQATFPGRRRASRDV